MKDKKVEDFIYPKKTIKSIRTSKKKNSDSSIKITNYKKHVAVKIKFDFKGDKNG